MRIPAVLSAAAVSAAALAPPANAAAPPAAELNLAVLNATGKPLRGALLTCPGGLGNHPYGERTCAALQAANGDFDALPRQDRVCRRRHKPVTAIAEGNWYGVPVRWRRTYRNRCVMLSETGPAFRFWG